MTGRCTHRGIVRLLSTDAHPVDTSAWMVEICEDCGSVRIAEHAWDDEEPGDVHVVSALPWRRDDS